MVKRWDPQWVYRGGETHKQFATQLPIVRELFSLGLEMLTGGITTIDALGRFSLVTEHEISPLIWLGVPNVASVLSKGKDSPA